MAFKRTEEKAGLELTSLIDIVFLLLIFFLVSFAFSLTGNVSESKIYSEMPLPKTNTDLPPVDSDVLNNLMIQLNSDSTATGVQRTAYVLWPSYNGAKKLTRGSALQTTMKDSTFASFPIDFIRMQKKEFTSVPACTLITGSVARYVELEKDFRRNKRPIVEIRADKNTEFKIVNFIMETCSAYGDNMPQVIVRTAL